MAYSKEYEFAWEDFQTEWVIRNFQPGIYKKLEVIKVISNILQDDIDLIIYEFHITRYTILQAGPVANAGTKDLKEISKVICKGSIDGERYRIGHSKIFFRAGK